MTIADSVADEHYGADRKTLAMHFAAILNAEARDLAAAGADVIQFDEPCFNIYLDEVEAWGIEALEQCMDGVTRDARPCTSATDTARRPCWRGRRRIPTGATTA